MLGGFLATLSHPDEVIGVRGTEPSPQGGNALDQSQVVWSDSNSSIAKVQTSERHGHQRYSVAQLKTSHLSMPQLELAGYDGHEVTNFQSQYDVVSRGGSSRMLSNRNGMSVPPWQIPFVLLGDRRLLPQPHCWCR